MKNKILLSLATIVATTTFSMADTAKDQESILKFYEFSLQKASVKSGKSIKIDSVKYGGTATDINGSNFKAYETIITISTPEGSMSLPRSTVFTNGNLVTGDIYNADLNQSYSMLLQPNIQPVEYTKDRLIAGNSNAEHKILVFSDPLCPYCIQVLPKLMELTKNNPEKFSLYLVHTPLTELHPASSSLVKALIVAKEKNIPDAILKIYNANFNPYHTEEQILLDLTQIDINLTKDDMINSKALHTILADKETIKNYRVEGTPTLYLDGKKIEDLNKIMQIAETKK